jgi:hypothetical protein
MYLEAGKKDLGYLKHMMIVDATYFSEEDFIPYVGAVNGNGEVSEWLFDSFLLCTSLSSGNYYCADINIGTTMSGEGDFYAVPSPNPSNKKDFDEAINNIIKDAHKLSTTIENLEKKLGKPEHSRNVIVPIPYPGILQTAFGEIDGKVLNFSVKGQNLTRATEDRLKACQYFIKSFIEKWKQLNLKNVNLLGFYWIFETVYRGWDVDDHYLLKELKKHINNMGFKSLWIPFWASYNVHLLDDYKKYYFDAAFMQPNYLFYEKITGLKEAAEAAKARNAGFELEYYVELHEPTKVGAEKHKRFRDYLNGGINYGYMEGACAWFVGGGLHRMLNIPEEREYYQDIVEFVKGRYKLKK